MIPNHIDVRPTEPDEQRTATNTFRAALLHQPVDDKDWAKAHDSWNEGHTSYTAWDGARCVGHAGAFHLETIVPGGARVPTAGVTRVGVLPTHTRQGLLTRMMRELLTASLADGRPVASLRASESVIYGRYGYGVGGFAYDLKVDTRRLRPLRGAAKGAVRLLAADEVLEVVPPLYERIASRPGAIIRPGYLWKRYVEEVVDGSKPHFVAVHTSPDGVDDGYIHYSTTFGERADGSDHAAEVFDLFGATPAVELALWSYLADVDLVRVIKAEARPLDDPLLLAAHDLRGVAVVTRWDEQWVRLLDVEAALAARTYAAGAPVTIAVVDPWFTPNCEKFEVGPEGVQRRASATPDIRTGIAGISAAYLGGTSWHQLAAAGQVEAASPDALVRADTLFTTHPTAFSGTFF